MLSGWILDIEILTRIFPNCFVMKANTAICFILAGLAQWLLQRQPDQVLEKSKHKWGLYFSVIFGAIGFLTLIEYYFQVNLGIDQLVLTDKVRAIPDLYPGRMAPNTALAFLLLAVSQIVSLANRKMGVLISQACALFVALLSLIALIGYTYGVIQLYKVTGFIGMALHTGLCFFALALGFFAANPGRGLTRVIAEDSDTAKIGFRLLVLIVAAPISFGWLYFKGLQSNYYGIEFGLALFVVAHIVILGSFVWKNLNQISHSVKKQKQAEDELRQANLVLESRVHERTLELRDSFNALKESELRFRAITQSANDAIVSANSEGNIIFWNRGAELIFGYEEAEVLGKALTIIMPERFRMAHQHGLSRIKSSVSSRIIGKTVELQGLKKNGAEFPIELSIAAWSAGNEYFYSGIIRDISERKNAEAQIAQQQQTLTHLSKMTALGEMAAGMAHEINNPLCIIGLKATHLKMLVENKKYDKLAKSIQDIESTTHRIAKIIKGLKIFGRDGSADADSLVEINVLIHDTISFCKEQFRSQGIALSVLGASEPLKVQGKATELSQALLNILYNARDAVEGSTEKRIQISVEGQEHEITLTVTDSGTGITPEIQDKIMQPFFTTKEVGKGMGLGLGIAKGIVEGHLGHLTFKSRAANTSFVIRLPKYREESRALQIEA